VLVTEDQLVVLEVHGSTPPAGPTSLRGGEARGEGVSRPERGKSGRMSRRSNNLRAHCVSRPEVEYFARFLNGDSDFQPHCVSRGLPVKSAEGVGGWPGRRRRLPHQPPSQPVLAVVVRVAPPPPCTGPAVALDLAFAIAAHVLAISDTGMRREPPPADPTRTLASHAALRVGQRAADVRRGEVDR
jgi:hypothetical protein